jgi:hypothetical protein
VERAGKPLVAIIAIEKYQRLLDDQEAAMRALGEIWQKMAGADSKEVEQVIEESIRAVRKPE